MGCPGGNGRIPGLNMGCPGGNGRMGIRILIMRGWIIRPRKPGGGRMPGRSINGGGMKPGGGRIPGRNMNLGCIPRMRIIIIMRPRGPPRK